METKSQRKRKFLLSLLLAAGLLASVMLTGSVMDENRFVSAAPMESLKSPPDTDEKTEYSIQEESTDSGTEKPNEEPVLFLLAETVVDATEQTVRGVVEKEEGMTDDETMLQMKEYMAEKSTDPEEPVSVLIKGDTYSVETEAPEKTEEPAVSAGEPVPDSVTVSYPDYLIVDPGMEEAGALANAAWNALPDSVRVFIAQRGWQIRITSGWFGSAYGFDVPLSGLTVYSERTSYITGTEFCINRALIHEIGHVVDSECGFPSNSEEFLQIYYAESPGWEEVENYGDNHGKSNPEEYFAETFKYILRYGDTYAYTSPETYAFVQRYIP